jgi:hypothetical protein
LFCRSVVHNGLDESCKMRLWIPIDPDGDSDQKNASSNTETHLTLQTKEVLTDWRAYGITEMLSENEGKSRYYAMSLKLPKNRGSMTIVPIEIIR